MDKKEQIKWMRLTEAMMLFSVDLTSQKVLQEIYEKQEVEYVPLLSALGYSVGCSWDSFASEWIESRVALEDRATVQDFLNRDSLIQKYGEGHTSLQQEFRLDRSYRTVLMRLWLEQDEATKNVLMHGSILDVTRQARSEERLARANTTIAKSTGIIDSLTREYHTIWTVDVKTSGMQMFSSNGNGTIFDAVVTGVSLGHYGEFMKYYIEQYIVEADRKRVAQAVDAKVVYEHILRGEIYRVDYLRKNPEGEVTNHQVVFAPSDLDRDYSEGVDTFLVAFRDIEELVRQAREHEELIRRSEIDLLTKLYNRGTGEDRVSYAIANRQQGLLCLLDIDFFKQFNDNYGHDIGDAVLISVAQSLRMAFREKDVVFRLGGDEFMIFAPGITNKEDATKLIHRFFTFVDAIEIPTLEGIGITTSVGAVLITESNEDDFTALYKRADAVMYESKKETGNFLCFE